MEEVRGSRRTVITTSATAVHRVGVDIAAAEAAVETVFSTAVGVRIHPVDRGRYRPLGQRCFHDVTAFPENVEVVSGPSAHHTFRTSSDEVVAIFGQDQSEPVVLLHNKNYCTRRSQVRR